MPISHSEASFWGAGGGGRGGVLSLRAEKSVSPCPGARLLGAETPPRLFLYPSYVDFRALP